LKYGATREEKKEEKKEEKEEEPHAPHAIVKSEVEIPTSLLGGSDRLSVTVSVGRPSDVSLGLEIKLIEGDWAKFKSPVGTTKLTFSSQVMTKIEGKRGKAKSEAEAGVKISQQVFKLPVEVYVSVAGKVVIDTESSAKAGPEPSVGATVTFDLSPPKRRMKD
jgi:hypothetical protein